MMRTKRLGVVMLACGAMAAATAVPSSAGIVPISRHSAISLEVISGTDDFSQNRSTDQFGVFDETLTHEHTETGVIGNGAHARGLASQNTDFDISHAGQILGSGNMEEDALAEFTNPQDVSGPVRAGGEASFALTFEVTDRNEPLSISGDLSGAVSQLSLDADVIANSTDVLTPPVFDLNFSLAPGMHTLSGSIFAGSSGSSPENSLSFEDGAGMNFNLSIGTPAATAIPLPPGVWTGASGLLVAAGLLALSQRRRCRV
jgi:hypothetical protein